MALKQVNASWDKLSARLTKFAATDVTMAQYAALSTDEKAKLKDSLGYFIGGWFADDTRRKESLVARSVLTLDLDYLEPWDLPAIAEAYANHVYIVHSTMSYAPERPKLRIVFPLARDVTLDEYEPLARRVASWFSIDAVDKVSYRPAQLMYWPAHCSDGAPMTQTYPYDPASQLRTWLDPDTILATYGDWHDNFEWPFAEKDSIPRPSNLKAENPLTKTGLVGAFCRAFNIHEAIRHFDLPYLPTSHPDRYTPVGATGSEGAVVYDDVFLYSHHSNDPASSKNLNAWDLVRLVRFGNLDADVDSVPGAETERAIGSRPSQLAMREFATALPEVVRQLAAAEGFEDLGPEEPRVVTRTGADADSAAPAPVRPRLTFDQLRGEIADLEPGPELRERCDRIILRIAAAKLEPTSTELLLKQLQPAYPVPGKRAISLSTLRDQLEVAGKRLTAQLADAAGGMRDIEEDLIQEVLREHFADGRHIKRLAKLFWTYEEGLWAQDEEERVLGTVSHTFLRLRKERPEAVMELVAAVGETKTSSLTFQLATLFKQLLAEREIRDDPLHLLRRYALPVINCRNVELHFDVTGAYQVRKHDPAAFHTVRIDTVYDPKATAPEWDRFCKLIFREATDPAGMQRHLEEVCGYVVQMSRWLKCWVLLHGPTNTGKTTVADVLKSLLGGAVLERELQAYAAQNRSNFAEASLIGKLLLVDDDQAKGALLPDGFIKKISEEKPITADIKFSDSLSFVCRALPMICSNHWPATRDLSDALRDRALVFPFTQPFTTEERSDVRKTRMLTDERSGILNRLVAGVARLRARGGWDVPEDCVAAHNKWVGHSNPLVVFVNERLVLDPSLPKLKCARAPDVWAAYTGWCLENVPDRKFRLAKHAFFEQLGALNHGVFRDSTGYRRVAGVSRVLVDSE